MWLSARNCRRPRQHRVCGCQRHRPLGSMALSNTMVTHAGWANLLAHGSATQNASPPFVPTVRVQYGGKSVNDMSRAQDPPHSPSKPLSAGGKQRQSSPHDSGPRDNTNHRKSSANHVDDVTQPQESRRGRSQASASGSRDIRFSPSTPKRSATQTQAHGNDGGATGGEKKKPTPVNTRRAPFNIAGFARDFGKILGC